MKFLFSLLCAVALFSCNDTVKENPLTADETNTPGTLYIESSIVGGLRMSWLWLGDDGSFVRNPVHGVNPVNYALEQKDNTISIGHYKMQDKKITATYEGGKTEVWEMEYDGKRLNTIDGLFVEEVLPMPSGYALNGTYSSGTFFGDLARISTFNFKPDGTFTLEGQGFVTTDDAAANSASATGGTYDIAGNTLKLQFNNGETSVSVIGLYQTGNTHYLVINSKFFESK